MLRPKVVTPYYMHGRGAQRWHSDHASRAATGAVVMGAAGAGLIHQSTRHHVLAAAHTQGYNIHADHANAFGHALGLAAAGTAGYAGYHAYKAHQFKKKLAARK